jgi:hypothetical protein
LAVGSSSRNPTTANGLAATSMPPLTTKTADHLPLARKAMDYFDASPDPFHAVQTSIDLLQSAGFEELPDGVPYSGKLVPGGKYYFTRNKSTLVAFSVGNKVQPGSGFGFKVIGGHTDSPNLKVKPRSKRGGAKGGTKQIGVECYGGGAYMYIVDFKWHIKVGMGVSMQKFLTRSFTPCFHPNHLNNTQAYGIPGLIGK